MKALAVFSGGLDSMLAVQLIRAQGIEVLGLFFETPFFSSSTAKKSAAEINLPIRVVDLTESHLEVLKEPRYGYGENLNPCIDCHILMVRKAGETLESEGAAFVVTGEVLGQRPMSQNRKALSLVASESGIPDLVLRPLSAKLLPATLPEQKGWVDRDRLLGLSGRSRKPQIALAKELGIEKYPSPAGGCLLTDPGFSRRMRDLLSSSSDLQLREIELLKVGRHFRIGPATKLIIGRNERENRFIRDFYREGDLLLAPLSVPGPTALAIGEVSPEQEGLVASMTAAYSDPGDGEEVDVGLGPRASARTLRVKRKEKKEFRALMI
ncbi:MAG: tRNA 4-thiouridine(8) synthase ThiI [Deltaproteobacteria bacterium]|nr:tRNA 4-thiouridine(8) synthase ThiI [Deltaproteobacteria bacterium]MBW2138382.1 tRNA 4-thiouridine(8) synthase ThiI [Deltaproteobacteria bacterium]